MIKIKLIVKGLGIAASALALVGGIKYNKKVNEKKGKTYYMPSKTPEKEFGDRGESEVVNLLKKRFNKNNVFLNKFIDEDRKKEIDVIILYNGHVIFIEIKNWKGRVYENEEGKWIQEKENNFTKEISDKIYQNHTKKLKRNCIEFFNKLKMENIHEKAWIDDVVIFSDECDISDLKSRNYSVCNIKDAIRFIENTFYEKGTFGENIVETISKLPTWDYICKDCQEHMTTIMSETIELLDFNDNPQVIYIKDIKSIKIHKSFFRIRKNKVEVKFKDGKNIMYYEHKAFIKIFNDQIVSLRDLDEIEFDVR